MYLLTIGNSFSCDATHYLHQIARCQHTELTVINLNIGGCPLSVHYKNMLSGEKAYNLEVNGCQSGFQVSLQEALFSGAWHGWDYISLQQVSHQAPYYESYQPYLSALAEYIRKMCPKSKILLHQTWAYEQGSKRLCEELGYQDQKDMFNDIQAAYHQAAKDISADGIIPSGQAFQNALEGGIPSIHRDTYHADLGIGRYLLGLTWYTALSGNKAAGSAFSDFDVPVDPALLPAAQKAAEDAAAAYGWTVK